MKQLWIARLVQSSAVAVLLWSGAARAQPTAPEPPPPLDPWYEALDFRLFVDAYESVNYNFPKPQDEGYGFRAYGTTNGFALSWVGADISHEPLPVGGTLSLRFGPTAERYAASCHSDTTRCDSDVAGLTVVKQAYASWRPGGHDGSVTLDFGKFDTIYGAEVAESQDNLNYTRGALYWLGQPLFHTGLRVGFDLTPELDLTVLAVNGWNNTIDNNAGKTFGLQLAARLTDNLAAYLGWLAGPEQDDSAIIYCRPGTAYDSDTGGCPPPPAGTQGDRYDVDQGGANKPKAWRHLGDLVVLYVPVEGLRLVLNGDFGVEGVREHRGLEVEVDRQVYYGGMLGARYALDETFAVAARGEYFADRHGLTTDVHTTDDVQKLKLVTSTLTLEAAPTDFLLVRLEGRGDFVVGAEPSKKIFKRLLRDSTSRLVTTTLGVVVKTN